MSKDQRWVPLGKVFPKPGHRWDIDHPLDVGVRQVKDPTLKQRFEKAQIEVGCGYTGVSVGCYLHPQEGRSVPASGQGGCLGVTPATQSPHHGAGPWEGRMVFQETLRRASSRFAWPWMYTQLSWFCNSCATCQISSGRGVAKALLQPLALIKMPFERIGMEVVKPLVNATF